MDPSASKAADEMVAEAMDIYQTEPERSERLAREVLAITTAPKTLALAYWTLGMIAWYGGLPKGARDAFQKVVDIRRLDDATTPIELIGALNDLGVAQSRLSDREAVLALRRETAELVQPLETEQPILARQIYRRLAQILHDLGKDKEAEEQYEAARPADDDPPDEIISWANSVGMFYEDRGLVFQALPYFETVIATCREHPEAVGVVAALGNAVQFLVSLEFDGRAAEALAQMRKTVRGDSRVQSHIGVLDARAELLKRRGRLEAAIRVAKKTEDLIAKKAPDREELATRRALRALSMRDAGRGNEARDMMREVVAGLHVGDDNIEAPVVLASLENTAGDSSAALAHLTRALAGVAGLERPMFFFNIFNELCQAASALGKSSAAVLFGKLAIEQVRGEADLLLENGLEGWVKSQLRAYDAVLDQMTLSGRFLEACDFQLDKSRRALWELGVRRGVDETREVTYREDEARLKDALLGIMNAARTAREEGTSAGSGISDIPGLIDQWLEDALSLENTATVQSARQAFASANRAIPEHVAKLTFLPRSGTYLGVLETADGARSFETQISPAELARLAREFRGACTGRWLERAGAEKLSRVLYDILLRPIDADLAGKSRLILSLQGFLSLLPFAALNDGRRYLVEKYVISLSSGVAGGRDMSRSDAFRPAVFADGGAGREQIPHAITEAERVAKIVGSTPITGTSFTAARLKSELDAGANLLHIASHFRYRTDKPLLSTLSLGEGEKLTLAELAEDTFDLSGVELLVLSCCSTAISDGDLMGLEGLVGLAQSKGVRTVVGSLWDVDDRATARMMAHFYRNLIEGPADAPPDALARAQRAMIAAPTPTSRNPGLRGGLSGGVAQRYGIGHWAAFCCYSG